jgi:anti-anti-sigma factor
VPLLTVAVTPAPERVVVRLAGEADLSTRPLLDEGLRDAAAAGDPVEVDLGDVRFFDSSCLGALGSFSAHLRAGGRTCRLVAVPPRTRRLIDLTGLGAQLALA